MHKKLDPYSTPVTKKKKNVFFKLKISQRILHGRGMVKNALESNFTECYLLWGNLPHNILDLSDHKRSTVKNIKVFGQPIKGYDTTGCMKDQALRILQEPGD